MSTVKPLKSMIPYVKRSACFDNIGQWIFNPERQAAYGVNEDFCNNIYSQLIVGVENYFFDTYSYDESALTMADLEAYAKEKGPFYIANVTKLMSETEDFNFNRDFDEMKEEKVVKDNGLDPHIPRLSCSCRFPSSERLV